MSEDPTANFKKRVDCEDNKEFLQQYVDAGLPLKYGIVALRKQEREVE